MTKASMKVCLTALGSLAIALGSIALTTGGCSSSSSGTTPGSGSGSGTGPGAEGGTTTTCSAANNILSIAFSPMYSAVVPNSTKVTFQVPAIVTGLAAGANVTWSASSKAVNFAADPTTGGVLITMDPAHAGTGATNTVTIIATAGGSCGQSLLTITSATDNDLVTGTARYNDGVPFTGSIFGSGSGSGAPDGGYRYACTDCHSPNDAGAGAGFNDVAHTPEQTGGFSDQQLLDIIQNGIVPGWSTDAGPAGDAGYFDTTILSYRRWHNLHQWGLTPAEKTGIVAYLRSIPPAAQTGTSNFGGRDGGRREGGAREGGPGEGGGPSEAGEGGSGSGSGPADATVGG